MNKSDPLANWNIVILPVQFLAATGRWWCSKREMAPLNLRIMFTLQTPGHTKTKKSKVTCPELLQGQ